MDSVITFATNRQSAQAQDSHRRSHAPVEYRVIWALMFAASFCGGVLVRIAVRPVAALLRTALGDAAMPAPPMRRRDATLIGEARAAADAAAPFVFQVS